MKILLIEDNPADSDLILEYAKEFEQIPDIEVKKNLQEGLKALQSNEYNLVLLDLCLPDSQEASETISKISNLLKKQDEKHTNIPIVVLTGLTDYKLAKQVVGNGIRDFLIKDALDPKTLERAISLADYGKYLPKKHSKILSWIT